MLDRSNLHDYQVKAVDFVKKKKAAALWIDMGLGKTISTLTALSDLLSAKKVKKVLIVAPLRVSKHTWPTEIHLWEHTSALKYTVLAGLTPAKRKAAVFEKTPIHIINRENIPWLVELLGQKWHYDMVVIDESSSFKSHSSKRWKSLRKVLGKIDRMVQLTGTPAPNNLMELWPQIYLLDKGKRLQNTRGKFLEKYCQLIGNPAWNQWAVKKDRVNAIYRAVRDVVLRMSSEDYLEMPDRLDVNVSVELPPKARKAYADMKRDFIIAYEAGEILAVNAAVQINKLLQISNGCIYTEEGYEIMHSKKVEALVEIADTSTEPLLVAYNFKSDLAEIKKAIPKAVVLDKNPKTIDKWNNGEIPVMLCHPASAGHGLNLQRGGSVIVWFGLNWSLELYQQFNARLHRQGQTKPVRVIHILSENTADARVLDTLMQKKDGQNALLDFVKGLKTTKS